MDQFYEEHPVISNLGIILVCLVSFLLFYSLSKAASFSPGISVSRALSHPDRYEGKLITVRGHFAGSIIVSTLILCDPPSCDCNDTHAHQLLLTDSPGFRDIYSRSLVVDALDCRGDECTLLCEGFTPAERGQYAFRGKLIKEGKKMVLTEVDLDRSKRKTGFLWLPIRQLGGEIDLGGPGFWDSSSGSLPTVCPRPE